MSNIENQEKPIEREAIAQWMRRNLEEYRDRATGEVGCTSLVEAWDAECSTGEATLDTDHPAWDVAVEVADEDSDAHSRARLRRG